METCNIFTYKIKSIKNTTPASINSNRSIVLSKSKSLVATGNKFVTLEVELPSSYTKIESKIKGIPTPYRIAEDSVKETVFDTNLPYEIQSIGSSIDMEMISATDSKGNLIVLKNNEGQLEKIHEVSVFNKNQYVELGWSGSSFNPSDKNIIARTQFFNKKIEILDLTQESQLKQSIQLIQNPTQIRYFLPPNSANPLLAVSELNQLKIFDPRLSGTESLVQKITPQSSADWIYAMSVSEDNTYIGVGGVNRSVYVYDTRKWTTAGSWKNCLKYEVSNIFFSSQKSSLCYAGGLDSEILAGEWNGSSGVDHFGGLRVDSKWLGMSKLSKHEFLFGFCASGSVYWIDHSDKLFQPKISRLHSPEPSSPNPAPHKKLKVSNENNNSNNNNE